MTDFLHPTFRTLIGLMRYVGYTCARHDLAPWKT
jgi:hypothetical protein